MKLLHTQSLATDLKGSYLLLDTTVFIDATKSDELLSLLRSLEEGGCSLVTIPSVVYEFTRNANNIAGYNERQDFIKGLKVIVMNHVEELLEKEHVFKIAYAKTSSNKEKGPSYTDALLCTMAYKHRKSNMLILTANHKDIPSSIFDRTELITIDIGGDLRTEAIYQLSSTKLNKLLETIS